MEQRKKVVFRKKASESIAGFAWYISEQGYPERAKKFADKLYEFSDSLAVFPEKYAVCRQPQLAKRQMRCAPFKRNYMFIYKVIKHQLIVYVDCVY